MLKFSTIAAHLQIKIAEKMDFPNIIQFELSSKHGKEVCSNEKQKSVMDVFHFWISGNDLLFGFKQEDGVRWRRWTQLRHIPNLPLFNALTLKTSGEGNLQFLNELSEKTAFVQNKVVLNIGNTNSPSSEVFTKLCQMLNITKVLSLHPPSQDFCSLPIPPEIELDICVNDTPELLLNLKCRKIRISDQYDPHVVSRMADTANLFLKDWYEKKRTIESFRIHSASQNVFNAENVISGLPYSIFLKYQGEDLKYKILIDDNFPLYCHLGEEDVIYSINRGDKKLLIVIWPTMNSVSAYEYVNAEDIIDIQPL